MGGVFIVPDPTVVSEILRRGGLEFEIPTELAADAHYAGVRGITELLASQTVAENDLDIWAHYDREAFGCVGIGGTDLDRAIEVRAAASSGRQRSAQGVAVSARGQHRRLPPDQHGPTGCDRVEQRRHGGRPMPKPRYLPTRAGRPPAARSGDRRLDDDRHAKPDPAIFDPALEALGTARDRTLRGRHRTRRCPRGRTGRPAGGAARPARSPYRSRPLAIARSRRPRPAPRGVTRTLSASQARRIALAAQGFETLAPPARSTGVICGG